MYSLMLATLVFLQLMLVNYRLIVVNNYHLQFFLISFIKLYNFQINNCFLQFQNLAFTIDLANQQNRYLMHNNWNNDHLLALTSSGVRQAKSDMVPIVPTSQPSTQELLQVGQRTNILHVIYRLVNCSEKVQTDNICVSNNNKLITDPKVEVFNHRSRSNQSVGNKARKNLLLLFVANHSQENILSLSTSQVDLASKLQEKSRSSPVNVSIIITSRNSHRRKRDLNDLMKYDLRNKSMNYITKRVELSSRGSNKAMVKLEGGLVNARKNSKKASKFLVLLTYCRTIAHTCCFRPDNLIIYWNNLI